MDTEAIGMMETTAREREGMRRFSRGLKSPEHPGRFRKVVAASVVLAVVAVLSLASAGAAHSAPRVALVVGNGGYDPRNITRLDNPVNDARLMEATLKSVGFEVVLATDAGQDEMKGAIKAFGRRLREAGRDAVGLFYYAGHGVEAGGNNYLIPLGAEVESATNLPIDTVPAQWVLSQMEDAGNRLNLVILDACRNNPYAGRVRGAGRGLARMDAPSGSLIAYSAAPGKEADDGEGENSPYTLALAGALVEPGLKVEDVFKRVRARVEEETGRKARKQTPWEHSSLKGDFYFVPPEVDDDDSGKVDDDDPVPDEAKNAWDAAKRENTIAAYRAVVAHFSGFYATLAQAKVKELEAAVLAEERRARRQALSEKLGREFSPEAVGENGWTDLHYAAALDLPGLAKELVVQGMEVDVRLDDSGEPFGDDLKRALRELGRNFDNWTSDRDTPLAVAVTENNVAAAEFLVGKGADVNAKDSDGETPLHWEARNNNLAAAEFLVGKGAEVNAFAEQFGTPLHQAAVKNHLAMAEYLVGQGADVHAKDSDGETPLHWAAGTNSLAMAEFLVGQGADVHAKDSDGKTPLHEPAESNSLAVVEFLVGQGADVHAKNNHGFTPLHLAASRNSLAVAEYLVGEGADVHAKTIGGKTPRDMAREHGMDDVADYLARQVE